MIQVIINDKQFDIEESLKFSFKAKNPFLANAELPGTLVYQVNGSISDNNRIITDYADQLGNINRKLKFENVVIKIGGLVWKTGVFILRSAGEGGYSFSFSADAGDAKTKIENLKLTDLPLETGVTVDDQSTDYYPTAKHVFFPVYNPDYYGNKNTDYTGYMNYFHNGSFGTNATLNQHTKVPFIYAMHVFLACFNLMEYELEGDILTDEDANRMVLFNTTSLDEINGSGLNTMKATFDYADHLPDVGIANFIIDTCIAWGVTPLFNSKKRAVKLVSTEAHFNDYTAKDFNAKVSSGNTITPNDYQGVTFIMKGDSRDKALEENADWLEFEQGAGKEVFATDFSTLQVALMEDTINTKNWTVPNVLQAGNSPAFELNNKQKSLRFLYFTGVKEDSATNNYPQGHYQGVDVNLRWEGFTGLVEKRYKAWLAYKATTENVDFELNITLEDLLNFSFENKLMAYYKRFIVAEYSASVGNEGISPMLINGQTF
jgi:hypothetical protein